MTARAVPATGTLKHASEENHTAPARALAFEALAGQFPGGQQQEKDASDVPGENHQVDRQSSEPRRVADHIGKQRQVSVRHEELGAERVQARVGHALDCRDIDGAIVGAEVIAVDQHRGRADQ
jgi:hypothetical protein